MQTNVGTKKKTEDKKSILFWRSIVSSDIAKACLLTKVVLWFAIILEYVCNYSPEWETLDKKSNLYTA